MGLSAHREGRCLVALAQLFLATAWQHACKKMKAKFTWDSSAPQSVWLGKWGRGGEGHMHTCTHCRPGPADSIPLPTEGVIHPREAKVFGKMSYSYSFFRSLSYFCHLWTQFRETTNVKSVTMILASSPSEYPQLAVSSSLDASFQQYANGHGRGDSVETQGQISKQNLMSQPF